MTNLEIFAPLTDSKNYLQARNAVISLLLADADYESGLAARGFMLQQILDAAEKLDKNGSINLGDYCDLDILEEVVDLQEAFFGLIASMCCTSSDDRGRAFQLTKEDEYPLIALDNTIRNLLINAAEQALIRKERDLLTLQKESDV